MGLPGGHGAIGPERPPGPPGPPGEPGPPGPAGQTMARDQEPPGLKGPYFKEEIKASDFPSFDGSLRHLTPGWRKAMPYTLTVSSPRPLWTPWGE